MPLPAIAYLAAALGPGLVNFFTGRRREREDAKTLALQGRGAITVAQNRYYFERDERRRALIAEGMSPEDAARWWPDKAPPGRVPDRQDAGSIRASTQIPGLTSGLINAGFQALPILDSRRPAAPATPGHVTSTAQGGVRMDGTINPPGSEGYHVDPPVSAQTSGTTLSTVGRVPGPQVGPDRPGFHWNGFTFVPDTPGTGGGGAIPASL